MLRLPHLDELPQTLWVFHVDRVVQSSEHLIVVLHSGVFRRDGVGVAIAVASREVVVWDGIGRARASCCWRRTGLGGGCLTARGVVGGRRAGRACGVALARSEQQPAAE